VLFGGRRIDYAALLAAWNAEDDQTTGFRLAAISDADD
jgi:hypothetical protein